MLSCLFCGNKLTGKQTCYCSRRCKDKFWNRKKREQIEGFKALNSALQKAGYEVRRLPADQDPSRVK
jgi:hypothetical protein